jgi:hypothetical protein
MTSMRILALSLLGASLGACEPPTGAEFIAPATAAVCGGGADAHEPGTPDATPPLDASPASTEAPLPIDGTPEPEAVTFEFTVDGASGPIRAEVRPDAPDLIQITALPSRFVATPRLGARVVPFPETFTKKFCDDIARAARNATNPLFPPPSRQLERERVRALTAQDLFLPLAPALGTKELESRALAAAKAAGISATALARPLPALVPKSIEISFSDKAISRTLGALEEVRSDFEAALDGADSAARSGELWVSTGAADVLCDLWSRAAEITVELELDGAGGATSRTHFSGLHPRAR